MIELIRVFYEVYYRVLASVMCLLDGSWLAFSSVSFEVLVDGDKFE